MIVNFNRKICLNGCNCIHIIIIKEFGYGATRSTDDLCVTDRFFVFKVQIVDPIDQNIFHMKI
jgi:FAD synthase